MKHEIPETEGDAAFNLGMGEDKNGESKSTVKTY